MALLTTPLERHLSDNGRPVMHAVLKGDEDEANMRTMGWGSFLLFVGAAFLLYRR